MTKMVLAAYADNCSFYRRTDKLDYPTALVADKVLVMRAITYQLVMAVVAAVFDLTQYPHLNQRRDQSVYGRAGGFCILVLQSEEQVISAEVAGHGQHLAYNGPPLRRNPQFQVLQEVEYFGFQFLVIHS